MTSDEMEITAGSQLTCHLEGIVIFFSHQSSVPPPPPKDRFIFNIKSGPFYTEVNPHYLKSNYLSTSLGIQGLPVT